MRPPSFLRTAVVVAVPVAVALALAGCASLATPEAPGSGSPAPGATATGGTPAVSQQVKDGAQLYVGFACVRCHAPDGVGGIPNRLNKGGDDTIPPLNNVYREADEKFTNAAQITSVLQEGGVVSKKPGVINMPSWNGVINQAQMDALAAYILAGFPRTDVEVDQNVAKASDIYTAYACIWCHGQVGPNATPPPAPNPTSADKEVPFLRNPEDTATLPEFLDFIMEGSVTEPGAKGELLMPAWGQILSTQQVKTILPYIQDGPKATRLPPPPQAPVLPLVGSASSSVGVSPSTETSGSP